MEQSSILSAKFDCPVAHQNVSLLATAHDYQTSSLASYQIPHSPYHTTYLGSEGERRKSTLISTLENQVDCGRVGWSEIELVLTEDQQVGSQAIECQPLTQLCQ